MCSFFVVPAGGEEEDSEESDLRSCHVGVISQIYSFLQEWCQYLPDIFGDDLMTPGGGVDAVVLVELGDAADVLEEEGDESGVVAGGQCRE
jgi:hypothetical protein